MTYDFDVGQGDSRDVPIQIKAAGVGVDLSGSTLIFIMSDKTPSNRFEITCTPGASILITALNYVELVQTVDKVGTIINFSNVNGWLTLPITSTHSATTGVYFGEFPLIIDGKQVTFPGNGNYITILVKEKL